MAYDEQDPQPEKYPELPPWMTRKLGDLRLESFKRNRSIPGKAIKSILQHRATTGNRGGAEARDEKKIQRDGCEPGGGSGAQIGTSFVCDESQDHNDTLHDQTDHHRATTRRSSLAGTSRPKEPPRKVYGNARCDSREKKGNANARVVHDPTSAIAWAFHKMPRRGRRQP
jgi:hypothetical protein